MAGEVSGANRDSVARVVAHMLGLEGCGLYHGREWVESHFEDSPPATENLDAVEVLETRRCASTTTVIMPVVSPDFRSAYLLGVGSSGWTAPNGTLMEDAAELARARIEIAWLRDRNARLEADVARLDRSERKVRETESQLRKIIDAAPVVIVACDQNHRITFANHEAETITGRDREDLRGRSVHIFEACAEGLKAVLRDGQVCSREERSFTGEEVYEARYFPLLGPDGEIESVCVVALDVTESERTRRQLNSAQLRYRTLFHSTADAMIIFEHDSRVIVDVNQRVVDITGVPRERMIGESVDRLSTIHQPGKRPLIEAIDDVVELEWPIRSATGEAKWFSLRMAPVEIDGVKHVIASGFDVTQQKVEEERRHLLEEDLLRAQRFDAIGRLAGGVAHDFNNLLSVILSYSELVQGELEDGELKDDVRQIEGAARRAAVLTRQLLVLGRRDLSKPVAVNVNEHVARIRELLARSLGEAISFETDFEDVGAVWIDPGQMDQILVNLTVNARDAMPGGGVYRIRTRFLDGKTSAARGLDDVDYVLIEVSDTGFGIASEVVEHMFEPFFTTKNVADGDGLGLGLAMVYSIVTGMGGHIRVQTEQGAGTTFELYIPAHEGPAMVVEEIAEDSFAEEGTTILVVEDEPSVLASVSRILESRGFEIIAVGDPVEALEVADERGDDIDILLSDVVMPSMSGPELAQRVRARIPELAVVFMSGYSDSVLPLDDFLGTRTDVLLKPFSRTALVDTVMGVLDGQFGI